MKLSKDKIRLWSRTLHRELSFFLSGMVLIYAISGLFMNHRNTFNPHYSVTRTEVTLDNLPTKAEFSREKVEEVMKRVGVKERYTKHYFPRQDQMKVFLSGNSSLVVDLSSGDAVYESLRRRHMLSAMTNLHYNPGKWWTWFSDFFAIGLMVITLTGLIMLKGKRGLWGRGGIEFAAGILLPLLLLLLS
ncbi:MAG: PepSY-associated TM helix domain-containing protein [Alistipes sp.]|nr:PepSY-associated TM helix domain-containing protein [Alistipes sp.]